VKCLLQAIITFLLTCCFIGVVFGNPIPWDPVESFLHLDPIQYFSIIVSEFCGLVVGIAILVHLHQAQWQKATLTMLIALTASYTLAITLWILAFQTGILTPNYSNPQTTAILLLPEIIGTLLGTVIIQKLQKTNWKTAITTMTAAMLTSLLISILLANTYLT